MNQKIISKHKTLQAPIKNVWWKWTTEEGIKTFFAPDCKVELKRGGAFEMYFILDNPPGLRGGEGCRVLSWLPEKMLSFSWNAPPQIPEIRKLGDVAWVVVLFEAVSENETLVKLNHLGFGEGAEWDKTYEYFINAWDKVMEWLETSCKP